MEKLEFFQLAALRRMVELWKRVQKAENSLVTKQNLKELRKEFNSAYRYDQHIKTVITKHPEACAEYLAENGIQIAPDRFWAELDSRLSAMKRGLK